MENKNTRTCFDINYYAIGNSYLHYPYSTGEAHVAWWMDATGNRETRGMAATSRANDYFGRICKGLREHFDGTLKADVFPVARAERSWNVGKRDDGSFDYDAALENVNKELCGMVEYIKKNQPNVITVQAQENTGLGSPDTPAEWFFTTLYTLIDKARPKDSVVIVISPIDGYNSRIATTQRKIIPEFDGFFWADCTWLAPFDHEKYMMPVTTNQVDIPDYRYTNENLAYMAYSSYDRLMAEYKEAHGTYPVDFRGHPSDKGFENIANTVLPILYEKIPLVLKSRTANVPERFEICEADGKYSICNVYPESASADVLWSVKQSEFASIDQNGVFSPRLNGKVTVCAQSAYDENVFAEKNVEICGCAPHFTLTYDAGTDDESVKNIPSPYEYASGNYTIPTFADIPMRCGYKFSGWSENVGGDAVKCVNMDGEKTVYAKWTFADDWQFNTDGDKEGAVLGGMHGNVSGGVATAITYKSGAASVSAENLAIKAENYSKLVTRMGFSKVEAGDSLVLTLNIGDKGTKTMLLALTTTDLCEYTFDLTDLDGTVNYFMLSSSNAEIETNTITVDYITFVKK